MTDVAAPAPPPARRTGSTRRRLGLGLRIVVALASLLVLVGSGVAWSKFRDLTTTIATGGDLPTSAPGGKDIDGVDQNILLVGNDSRAGATPAELAELSTEDDGGSSNTDTMIVLHVPADGSKATLISFPRDSYVDIPGYASDRLNAAYPDAYNDAKAAGKTERKAETAGLTLTAETISNLTGLRIDHYLQISLLGFYRISKALDGVTVCLNNAMGPATEYGQTGDGFDSGTEPDGTFVYSYSGIDLKKGVQTIEGKQALAFVRQRHGLPGSDLDRVARQRYFLGAVFRKVSTAGTLLNPFKLNALLSAVSSSLLTDRSLKLLDLAAQLQNLSSGNIIGATMVTTGYENIDGKDVLGVDPPTVKAQMKQLIGVAAAPSATPSPTPTVAAADVSVTVLNGGGVGGAASDNAQRLTDAGFTVVGTGDAPAPAQTTTITYPAGQQSQAATLAALVQGATVQESADVTGVTLTLGADGLGVAAPGSTATAGTSAPVPASGGGTPAVDTASGGLACIN